MEEAKLSPKMSNMFCVKFTNAEGVLIAGSEYLSKQLKTILIRTMIHRNSVFIHLVLGSGLSLLKTTFGTMPPKLLRM